MNNTRVFRHIDIYNANSLKNISSNEDLLNGLFGTVSENPTDYIDLYYDNGEYNIHYNL
jgi:hypothetical protein